MSANTTPRLDTERFWSANQPGFRFTDEQPGTPEFFTAVERHRYEVEPHIPEIVQFARWRDRDVLEVGCGIATDGINFARTGARYTGTDQSASALALARRRFELEGLSASFVESQADHLPFADDTFDLVYSHGVIHHMEDTAGAVDDFMRVLRPGGTALVMVYHRSSFNYWVTILGVRRLLATVLLMPGLSRLVARATGERASVLDGHRALLRRHGLRYLLSSTLFLSNNTDGPGNPLSKVFTREQAEALFGGFASVSTAVRHLNLRIYPGGTVAARSRIAVWLGHRWGWHLYVRADKGSESHLCGQE
ncbi:MAG: class I SAM-dependent methyltransferase [Solirubrobacteraceae bacterium]